MTDAVNNRNWLKWARALQAVSQTGLHFSSDQFDRERYGQVGHIAAEIIAGHTTIPAETMVALNAAEFGYATPKVDVRGVVFREGKVLLVREVMDNNRWTLPGGWADVNESPAEAVTREVFEESGFETRAAELFAVYDREKHGHEPPFPYHIYKLFFRCEITGGAAKQSHETSGVAFFGPDELPELSVSRVTEAQLMRFFERYERPVGPAEFD